MAQQELDNVFAFFRFHGSAPPRHLIYLTLPLRAGELLAGDHVFAVATNTRPFHRRWELGNGYTRFWWQRGGGADFDPYLRDYVPQVAGGVPFLDQRLRLAGFVGSPGHEHI